MLMKRKREKNRCKRRNNKNKVRKSRLELNLRSMLKFRDGVNKIQQKGETCKVRGRKTCA